MLHPEVLIISNRHDFATDHVAFQLKRMGASYLRLNRDQFSDFRIAFLPTAQRLYGEASNFSFQVSSDSLKSIYFRAPVFLRDNYKPNLPPEQQLSRSQWAAFIRGLTAFDNVLWINHPQATYQAEIKPYQLYIANKIGFDVPETVIANSAEYYTDAAKGKSNVIVKTLDPVLLNLGEREAFIYTNEVSARELMEADISTAPVIIQESLIPKIDIRVTVVCDFVFAVAVTKDGEGLDKDWRLEKNDLKYIEINLPSEIETMCKTLVASLGLRFGAIDLALHKERYYFLEINPTGEWAWLLRDAKARIDDVIAESLLGRRTL
ncbi:MAG: RimK-like protein [Acidobacteriota bacterium]|nr:RimK-like protein [Acidobacteriota bacterium]